MKPAVYCDGINFIEAKFKLEADFEKIVKDNSKILFGEKTIYLDVKNKINTKALGAAILDGFLFNFENEKKPEFYFVEVELEAHSFDGHIFPQIKKCFAFFKNSESRDELIGKLFDFIKSNPKIEQEFKNYLKDKEIYKALKDIIENNQNILLVIDENKPEFEETANTITEWAKFVKVEILKQYVANGKTIFMLDPNFENVGFAEQIAPEKSEIYSESFHLDGVEPNIISTYEKIKQEMIRYNSEIKINPQHYYISLRQKKNFAFIYLKKKKMWLTLMMPYKVGAEIVKKHEIYEEGKAQQNFYGAPCFSIMIETEDNFDEIIKALEEAYKQQNK